jgi:hypothetical protein
MATATTLPAFRSFVGRQAKSSLSEMILPANESKNAVSQRGITPKNTMDAVNSVNQYE